ncbi:WXG100 family type VII secretion target [bacterium]|nr:WXG100 family type VII secretion target [bacterium]
MSNEIVRVDHEALEQVTGKFGTHAQATTETVRAIQRAYDPLKNGGWIGQGASAFYAEMDEQIIPALRRLAAALDQAEKTTAEIRALMRSAEEDAAAHFKSDGGAATSGEATSGEATSSATADGSGGGENGGSASGVPSSTDGGASDGSTSDGSTSDGSVSDGSLGGGSSADGSNGGGAAADVGSGLGGGDLDSGDLGGGLPTFDELVDWNDDVGSGLGTSPEDNYFGEYSFDDAGLIDGSFGDDGDYAVPADWLDDLFDAFGPDASLSDYWADDYMVPQDWLSPVMDGVAADLANLGDDPTEGADMTANGTNEAGGMGSGGGGGPGEAPTEPASTEPESEVTESEREATPASSGGGGSGGNVPLETNFGSRGGNGIFPFVPGSEGTATEPTSASARFHYQSTGGGAGTVADRAQASFVLIEGSSTPAAAQTPSGPKTPLLMALASPLLALLGRAVKNKMEEK